MNEIRKAFADGIPDMAAVRNAVEKEERSGGGPVSSFTIRWHPEFAADLKRAPLRTFTEPGSSPVSPVKTIMKGFEYPFLVCVPQGYRPDRPYPAVLFLHGIGERGSDPVVLKDQGPFRFIAAGHSLPFLLFAPQAESGQHWTEDPSGGMSDRQMMRLERFLRELTAAYPIDPSRLYLTGLSMGGRGALRLACLLNGTFAAAAVCCGRAAEKRDPERLMYPLDGMKSLPIWLFHGTEDGIVPPEHSLCLIKQLMALDPDGDRRLTMYPHVKHGCFDHAYLEPELYAWLGSHRLERK